MLRGDCRDRPATALWWAGLSAVVVAAALLRMCNLGSFSLGLDEGLTMARAALPFREMMAACAADGDNPPLYLVITQLSLRAGLTEPWFRLVPIAAGLASIAVWSWWTRRHFGETASLLLAAFLALSTFHIRYSQELRAYPYLLLLTGIAMLVGERLREHPGILSSASLAVTVAVGWYLHLSFALVLVPLAGLVLGGAASTIDDAVRRQPKVVAWFTVAIAAGTAAFLPWFLYVRDTITRDLSQGATSWSLAMVGRRWQFLTVAASHGEALDWLGLILAMLAIVGTMVAARSVIGRSTLLPAIVVVVASEVFMVLVNRWSQGRYNTALWPMIAVLVALGLERILAWLPSWWLRAALLGAITLVMLARVDAYQALGRPHWDRVAAAVAEARRPGEPILAESDWTGITLAHYLGEPVATLTKSTPTSRAALEGSPSILLVVRPRMANPHLARLARRGALIARVPQTGALYRLRPESLGLARRPAEESWPTPASELVSGEIEAEPRGCLNRWLVRVRRTAPDAGPSWSRLELDAASTPFLRSGWSGPRSDRHDMSYRVVVGPEAAVVVTRPTIEPCLLSLRLWPAPGLDGQQLRLVVNGHIVGSRALDSGRQVLDFATPASVWRPGRNLIVLQLRELDAPGDDRSPSRAAGVDWIEIAPTR